MGLEGTMKRLLDGARNPANDDVLQFLERQGKPGMPEDAAGAMNGYELHTHPDLIERLVEAGASLDAPLVAAYGVAVLTHPNQVIFTIAYSMSALIYRLPTNLHSRVVPSRWTYEVGKEWISANAWLPNLASQEGTARVREWCRWAYEHAARLGGRGGA
jgi:hypothetical protein